MSFFFSMDFGRTPLSPIGECFGGLFFYINKSREQWSSRTRGYKTHTPTSQNVLPPIFQYMQLFCEICFCVCCATRILFSRAFCIWNTAFQISNKPQMMGSRHGIDQTKHHLFETSEPYSHTSDWCFSKVWGENTGHMYQCICSSGDWVFLAREFHILHWRVEGVIHLDTIYVTLCKQVGTKVTKVVFILTIGDTWFKIETLHEVAEDLNGSLRKAQH